MKKITALILAALINTSVCASSDDLQCLAKAVYYEARGESRQAKIAVAKVVTNRTEHPDFPNTICKVVYQPSQFSWVTDKKVQRQKKDKEAWQDSIQVAKDVLAGYNLGTLSNFTATHFHNTKVKPGWKLKRIAKIGNHIFYANRVQRNR